MFNKKEYMMKPIDTFLEIIDICRESIGEDKIEESKRGDFKPTVA